eukprot:m.105237 g.105237  ORF g.105237 m.105237 type:complete len:244 (+) comp16857_c0_seq1:298-1029(+)
MSQNSNQKPDRRRRQPEIPQKVKTTGAPRYGSSTSTVSQSASVGTRVPISNDDGCSTERRRSSILSQADVEEKAREVEKLREMRVNTMRDQIVELQHENQHLAEHLSIAQDLQAENSRMADMIAELHGHRDDLFRILSCPWENITLLREELRKKYHCQLQPLTDMYNEAPLGSGKRDHHKQRLESMADALDGMLQRAERGRQSLESLRCAINAINDESRDSAAPSVGSHITPDSTGGFPMIEL